MKAEGGGEVWNGSGGAGDEGGGHIFQLTRLQQHANSDTSFSRLEECSCRSADGGRGRGVAWWRVKMAAWMRVHVRRNHA
ncbi:uncharacterized protein LOC124426781 isoform X2 [Vespa crabro]|uniref:uncharacterized protein LOC124426781 isoform X2 n=1 Tax=Vespa crabro TaxID=7445 RepID=UPI001F00EDBC|nr:uncharacterized protein LOC124426781 isoform X2 [Vespa crabro]